MPPPIRIDIIIQGGKEVKVVNAGKREVSSGTTNRGHGFLFNVMSFLIMGFGYSILAMGLANYAWNIAKFVAFSNAHSKDAIARGQNYDDVEAPLNAARISLIWELFAMCLFTYNLVRFLQLVFMLPRLAKSAHNGPCWRAIIIIAIGIFLHYVLNSMSRLRLRVLSKVINVRPIFL